MVHLRAFVSFGKKHKGQLDTWVSSMTANPKVFNSNALGLCIPAVECAYVDSDWKNCFPLSKSTDLIEEGLW